MSGLDPLRHYDAIAAQFGFDQVADRTAAALLHTWAGTDWDHLTTRLRGRKAIVVGCGPDLARVGLSDLVPATKPRTAPDAAKGGSAQHVIVAADGATTRLRELGIVPHAVVTDLDGPMADLAWAASQKAVLVVHAHGDNMHQLQRLHDEAPPEWRILGTCQCDPRGVSPLRNLGGFTDGDRAVLLCHAAGSSSIRLLAFQPEDAPSHYSHRFDPATKPAKLAWAARIIDEVRATGFTVETARPAAAACAPSDRATT